MKVCFFDIDGTLLKTGGSGGRAMISALVEEFGLPAPDMEIPYAGRSDRAIVDDIFRAAGLPLSAETRDRFTARYLRHLEREVRVSAGQLCAGVTAALDRVSAAGHVRSALLTGNIEAAAWIKLRHFRLENYFTFGGFGDRQAHRDDIAREAADLAERSLGRPPAEIYVIGDTPADVACGKAIGATTAAVATGTFTLDELRAAGADYTLPDLTHATELLSRITA